MGFSNKEKTTTTPPIIVIGCEFMRILLEQQRFLSNQILFYAYISTKSHYKSHMRTQTAENTNECM